MLWRQLLKTFVLVVSLVTPLTKDQSGKRGQGSSTKNGPLSVQTNAGPSPRRPFFVHDPSKVPKRTAKQTGSRFDGWRSMHLKPSMGHE